MPGGKRTRDCRTAAQRTNHIATLHPSYVCKRTGLCFIVFMSHLVCLSESVRWYSHTAKKIRFMYCIPRNQTARPQSQCPLSCMHLWAIYSIYSHDRSSCSRLGRPTVGIYINRSQKHQCRNWERGHAVPFLEIFVSNVLYSVFAVHTTALVWMRYTCFEYCLVWCRDIVRVHPAAVVDSWWSGNKL